jgi:hypothetical protein
MYGGQAQEQTQDRQQLQKLSWPANLLGFSNGSVPRDAFNRKRERLAPRSNPRPAQIQTPKQF